ncbi:MAG: PH domain-containing protein [Prosthecobacter sp.]|nr:PH domain-containing protein [Prosthecobacter sp.]
MTHYRATWSTLLRVITVAASLLCVTVAIHERHALASGDFRSLDFWFGVLPLALLIGTALCTVRGYSITPDAIFVHRLCWKTRLPRQGLESAEYQPGVLRHSFRTCGNGGLFSFTGWYYNSALGTYRAYATDIHRTVVLRLRGKTIVVTPDEPERFVSELKEIAPDTPLLDRDHDGSNDADGDGHTNLEEFLNETDPKRAEGK